jgi:PPM family protein phosphatase
MDLNTSIASLNLTSAKASAPCAAAKNPMDIGTCSDMGRVRENNEDNLRVAPEMNLFVLSDGMGGMACGEVASRITVDTVATHCREVEANRAIAFFGEPVEGVNETSRRLASGIQLANRIVLRTARENSARTGMGATVVAAQYKDRILSVAHVGDSRAYRFRNGCLEQLTQDHSLAAEQLRLGQITEDEVSTSGLQNILTRAVGIEPQLEVSIAEESMLDGDIILLCSDGLTHELSDKQIAGVLRDAKNAQQAAARLVALANQAGGADNITTIVIRLEPKVLDFLSRLGRISRWFNILAS